MVELGKGLESIAVGPGGRLIAGADRPRVRIDEPATGYRGVIDIGRPIAKRMFTPGESLIVGGKYGEISVWQLGDFAHHAEISDQGDVLALHLTADVTMLGVSRARKRDNGDSGPAPPRIRRWQAGSAGKALDPPLVPTATAVAFNTDGRYVVLLDASNSRVLIHETSSGSPRAAIAGIGAVQLFALDQDGSLLATAGAGKVLTRDIASGAVTLGIFSGDGRFLAVYDGHGTTTIWNTEHQERIARVFHRPDMAPRALSRDARHIAVAGSGGDLLVVSLWPDDLLSEACTTICRTQLTPLEWKRHIGHGEPRPTCPE